MSASSRSPRPPSRARSCQRICKAYRRHLRPDASGCQLSLRRAGLRSRGRFRYRRSSNRPLRRGGRCRARHQSADPARSDAWRDSPRCRPALLEESYYEPRSGQLLAASFMDYAMPRADTLPFLATALSEVPTPTNRLGVRSGSQRGTTPALVAVINAIDALAELGGATSKCRRPPNVWRAIWARRAAAAV
jgi:hypothetical protein